MQLQLIAQTITAWQMRYAVVGDWKWRSESGSFTNVPVSTIINVEVAETGNSDYDFLIAIHELIEGYLCQREGITTEQVDKHDMAYPDDGTEPGDDVNAPYKKQHQIATVVEMLLLAHMGYDVRDYEDTLGNLYEQIKEFQNGRPGE